jgi:hypothetical protein
MEQDHADHGDASKSLEVGPDLPRRADRTGRRRLNAGRSVDFRLCHRSPHRGRSRIACHRDCTACARTVAAGQGRSAADGRVARPSRGRPTPDVHRGCTTLARVAKLVVAAQTAPAGR